MTTILIIIVSVLAVGFLAYLIVNKIPKKIRPIISILLWLLIIFLGYKIYEGIMGPIEFNKQKRVRYAKVIDNLKMIRDAEIAYKEVTGNFSNNPGNIVAFIDTAKFAVTKTSNIVEAVNKGTKFQPIMVDVEKRVVDTIGYKDVRADFAGRDYKNMFKVPGTDATFELKTGFVEKIQGIQAPVFEARIDKAVVLAGLNRDYINQEKDALGGIEVRGEYISVGSLDDVKTSGNWPPFYDTSEEKNNDD